MVTQREADSNALRLSFELDNIRTLAENQIKHQKMLELKRANMNHVQASQTDQTTVQYTLLQQVRLCCHTYLLMCLAKNCCSMNILYILNLRCSIKDHYSAIWRRGNTRIKD